MEPRTNTLPAQNHIQDYADDEARLLKLLEDIEEHHGFIPKAIADEVEKILEIKRDRINTLRTRIESQVRKDVRTYIDRWGGEEGNLIMILHEIQNQHGYVPRNVVMELAREMGIRLARIYEVLTFYHYFKLVPPGKHNCQVCLGTACYLKGSANLEAELERMLGIPPGQTTADREWHFEVVRCIGCCGLAPALVVDGKTHGKVMPSELHSILSQIAPVGNPT